VRIDGDPGVIELEYGSEENLLLRIHLPHWRGLIHHVQRARRIFNLDADHERAVEALHRDKTIGALVRARPGLRVPGTWDQFETGVRAIVGQQVSVVGANTVIARLAARCGTPVAGLAPLGLTHLFPTPGELAEADLDGLGLTGARALAIRGFAQRVEAGAIDLDGAATLEQLLETITATVGLGPWTAQYIALRMGEPDAFPAGDLGLRRALEGIVGRQLNGREVSGLAERWRPYRALAAAHLWHAGAEGRLSDPHRSAPRPSRRALAGGARGSQTRGSRRAARQGPP
jgi:AraC family transcriptional regulator of adaptative response / DNA-3-methyladenine glycosylase II